jgi:4-amino-4-deoxy-L-arabinose transferase-like glycosyltransferase
MRSWFAVQRGDLAFTWALTVVALVPRLFVALAWAREPVWDGHYYHFGAERLAAGLGYSEDVLIDGQLVWKPWTHYPVGYSAFLGAVYRLFGSSILVAPVANALVGTLTTVVVYRLARSFLSERRAAVAGALCALHPGLIVYSAVVMTEPLAALLLLGAAWCAVAQRPKPWAWLGAGVLLGLASLVRPASLLAVPLVLFLLRPPLVRALVTTVAVGAVTLLTILPWTVRNCRVMDGCALISTNGGWNLAIGALTTTGRFQTLRAADGCPVVTGQVQQDRCWADVGMRLIREDPNAWLARVPLKLSHTFDHESFAIEYLREAAPEQWPEPRRAAGRHLLTVFHWLLLGAAALAPVARITRSTPRTGRIVQAALGVGVLTYFAWSLTRTPPPLFLLAVSTPLLAMLPLPGRPEWLHPRAGRDFLGPGPAGYLLGLLAITTLTHAVFFGDDRYHLVVTPVLCLLAAAALRRPVLAPSR